VSLRFSVLEVVDLSFAQARSESDHSSVASRPPDYRERTFDRTMPSPLEICFYRCGDHEHYPSFYSRVPDPPHKPPPPPPILTVTWQLFRAGFNFLTYQWTIFSPLTTGLAPIPRYRLHTPADRDDRGGTVARWVVAFSSLRAPFPFHHPKPF